MNVYENLLLSNKTTPTPEPELQAAVINVVGGAVREAVRSVLREEQVCDF